MTMGVGVQVWIDVNFHITLISLILDPARNGETDLLYD
jgi:hypothetical protein